jgi:7,8-dihydropterin-6-yl-methyl-4-(beta-D-ribofuranosyl)aminobenzene 5'-phosphate synthase
MKVTVLVENTSLDDSLECEHGLSLHIETRSHSILFDMGASGIFAGNAAKMGIDLSAVDVAVISHGHYDHGGGLGKFLEVNSRAKIYAGRKAFERYFAARPNGVEAFIGLDESLVDSGRFVFVEDGLVIDDELELFSRVKGRRLYPSCNRNLLKETGGMLESDDFAHEQNLIISENGMTTLVAGCAHNGILNILDTFREKRGMNPSHVIGGFHLYSGSSATSEDRSVVDELGTILMDTGAQFHTCHCTGIGPYEWLRGTMGDKIDYISTGTRLNII